MISSEGISLKRQGPTTRPHLLKPAPPQHHRSEDHAQHMSSWGTYSSPSQSVTMSFSRRLRFQTLLGKPIVIFFSLEVLQVPGEDLRCFVSRGGAPRSVPLSDLFGLCRNVIYSNWSQTPSSGCAVPAVAYCSHGQGKCSVFDHGSFSHLTSCVIFQSTTYMSNHKAFPHLFNSVVGCACQLLTDCKLLFCPRTLLL